MRETFPREAAASPEPFTGERLTADIHGQVEIEHYHRYLFARTLCRDRDVLDVASGEGYGAAHLAQVARHVTGVEYSGATTRNAAANFPRDNLRFVQGDARMLPLADASVDVATSFETIEHFDRQDEFVAEIRRVLRADGCFIVSTPDRDIYSPPGTEPNPYHVREFDRAEFLDLLHCHFAFVSLVRQRPILASVLIPEETASVAPVVFERDGDNGFSSDTLLPRAPYLIAIASDVAPPVAPFSLLVERGDIDNIRSSDRQAELERARQAEMAALQAETAAREAEMAALQAAERAEAEARVAERAEAVARRTAERAEAEARAANETLTHTRAVLAQTMRDLERVGGSARHFLRQYLPRLWRYLLR